MEKINEIIEEFELKALRLQILSKKHSRNVFNYKRYYQAYQKLDIAPQILTHVKKSMANLNDSQKAALEFKQNIHYFEQLKRKK
jgi:hypothetical protein